MRFIESIPDWALSWREPRKAVSFCPPLQTKMCRVVNHQGHHQQIADQIHRSGHRVLLDKEDSASPIHIVFGTPKVVDRHQHPASQGLQFPAAPVIPKLPDRPQQQGRRDQVEQTQQAYQQGQMRIEHELSAADGMMSAEPSSRQIKNKDGLKQQQADRLPREEQWALRPERNRNQEIAEVAKEQKVLRAILLPINRRPTKHEDRPDDLEPEGQAHAEHCTSELRASSHELRAKSSDSRDASCDL